jgi:hypothetical protein
LPSSNGTVFAAGCLRSPIYARLGKPIQNRAVLLIASGMLRPNIKDMADFAKRTQTRLASNVVFCDMLQLIK